MSFSSSASLRTNCWMKPADHCVVLTDPSSLLFGPRASYSLIIQTLAGSQTCFRSEPELLDLQQKPSLRTSRGLTHTSLSWTITKTNAEQLKVTVLQMAAARRRQERVLLFEQSDKMTDSSKWSQMTECLCWKEKNPFALFDEVLSLTCSAVIMGCFMIVGPILNVKVQQGEMQNDHKWYSRLTVWGSCSYGWHVGGLGAFYLYPEPVVSICPQLKDLWSFLSMYDVILISAGFKFKQVLWGFYMHSGKCRQYFRKLQS